jgi:hypothetical protein
VHPTESNAILNPDEEDEGFEVEDRRQKTEDRMKKTEGRE